MELTTRPLKYMDFREFVLLSDQFLDESPLFRNVPEKDVDDLVNFFKVMFEFPDEYFAQLGFADGVLAGMAVAHRMPFIFARSNFVQDVMFYIFPEFRGTLLIRKLVRDLEKWAFADKMCHLVQLTAMASADNDRTQRLIEALGYKTVGHFGVKER